MPELDGYGRQYGAAYSPDAPGTKSFVVTWLLALFLGSLGIDRFYLGKVGTGVFKHFALGGGASAPRAPTDGPTAICCNNASVVTA